MSLSIKTTRSIQAVLGLLHLVNLLLPQIISFLNLSMGEIPTKYRGLAAGILAILNWYVNDISHKSSPDGTKLPPPAK